MRRRKHPDGVVTYIVDRNVNYTNVCTTSCRFCAFYRPVGHPEGYVLSREVLGQKLQEVVDAGGVQILLQGGLNPELRIELVRGSLPLDEEEYASGSTRSRPRRSCTSRGSRSSAVDAVLERLHAAGLDSVPGGGAEILVDRVRRKIAKAKCTSDEWLEVMRVAHHMGLRSSATMMYGTVDTHRGSHPAPREDPRPAGRDRRLHRVHLLGLPAREGTRLQAGRERHAPLPAHAGPRAAHARQRRSRRRLVGHARARTSAQVALRFGADDFGSVMFEENVVSSAGTTFRIDADAIESRIRAAGFRAARRNVRYEWLTEPA